MSLISLIPTVRGALFDLLTGALTGPEVLYEWDGNVGATDLVITGGLAEEDALQAFQNFGGATQPARQENFRLVVMVRATPAGCTAREAYERCYGWVAQVEQALRPDPTLGMAEEGVQRLYVDRFREAPAPTGEGWSCAVDVYVNVQTLI